VRRRGAWLGSLLIGGLSAVAAPNPGIAWQAPDPSVVASNTYGDTVWFDSAVMTVGSRYEVLGLHGGSSPSARRAYATARGRTRGTPFLIQMVERDPSPPAREVVYRALAHADLGLGGGAKQDAWNITTHESSAVDNYEGRRLENWSVDFLPEDSSSYRLIFVVIGLSDSSVAAPLHQAWQEPWGRTRSPGDPMPIRVDQHLRPFEIPAADRLSTARIVGEFRANLKLRRIERIVTPSVMDH
jgi:hypothetical protein